MVKIGEPESYSIPKEKVRRQNVSILTAGTFRVKGSKQVLILHQTHSQIQTSFQIQTCIEEPSHCYLENSKACLKLKQASNTRSAMKRGWKVSSGELECTEHVNPAPHPLPCRILQTAGQQNYYIKCSDQMCQVKNWQ